MIEGLFILTTIFVAYVVYAIIGDQRASAKSKALAEKAETQVIAVEQSKPPVAVAQEKPATVKPAAPAKTAATKSAAAKKVTPPAAKPATAKSTATQPAAKPAAPKTTTKPAATKATTAKPAATKQAPAAAASSTGLKNPKTGEIATAYHNYRFTKRWIKDALVEEGLLDKVYTANELNPEVDVKIKQAIAKLEAMDKYKA